MGRNGRRTRKWLALALLAGVAPAAVSAQAIRAGFTTTSDGRNDDGTFITGGCTSSSAGTACQPGTAVNIGFTGNFFGTNFSSLFLNTNGNATIGGGYPNFTPGAITAGGTPPIFAPFWADVDTRNTSSGVLQFGSSTVDGHTAFGVDWLNVGYFSLHADKLNSFQLVLIDRSDTGAGNFDFEFNYGNIFWETGDASNGSNGFGGNCAAAGYSNGISGAGNASFEIAGSTVCGALINGGVDALNTHDLNSTVAGRYLFSVRNGAVVVVSATPEPSTIVLMLSGLMMAFVIARRRKIA